MAVTRDAKLALEHDFLTKVGKKTAKGAQKLPGAKWGMRNTIYAATEDQDSDKN